MELNNDDVVSVFPDISFKAGGISKVEQLCSAVKAYVASPHSNWFQEAGVSCEVLKTEGGGWQKGKIRFRLEFIPDEPKQLKPKVSSDPNSPLSDLRSNLDI